MRGMVVTVVAVVVLLGVAAAAVFFFKGTGKNSLFGPKTEEIELTEYRPPPAAPEDVLTDDRLEDKTPKFDPALVDRRPLGRDGAWLLNASAAVIRLDVPMILPDQEGHLLTLHPSYADAVGPNPAGQRVLPSVNLLDGKAKQFDDGLYAALDQAYYQGLKNHLTSHVELVRRLYEKAGKDNVAAPYLAAGLELAGITVEVSDRSRKEQWLGRFRADEIASKPIGFYTWNETLSSCFRFLRFFQQPFSPHQPEVPLALAKVLARDPALLADYRKALHFYTKLTNPSSEQTIADLLGDNPKLTARGGALFPASTSKETVLFEKLFPQGLPPRADLMRELIRRIRSGDVDLRPGPDSGWYEYQAYALETLLLPEKGAEHDKLLLTKAYKKRMLEAFQALVTKRRETHIRQLEMGATAAAPPPDDVHPRLRVEPCPSYYLRTARAYAFLANFLEAAVGPEALHQLHGLKQGGPRTPDLHVELRSMRDLFYGLYLVSAEDIGLKPSFAKDEGVDADRCYRLAADWLPKVFADEDLKADTRVAVPVFVDPGQHVVRLWVTLGVRLAKLEAGYARPPQIKLAKGAGEWTPVEDFRLRPAHYLVPVDEFAEVELVGPRVLTRAELRAVCDREKTKDAIVRALRR